jgi:L-cysteine desulfidase
LPHPSRKPVEKVALRVDPGTYKNGAAVVVPQSGGAKGNLIAATLGAVIANPEAKLLLLQGVTAEVLARAKSLMAAGKCQCECGHAIFTICKEAQSDASIWAFSATVSDLVSPACKDP